MVLCKLHMHLSDCDCPEFWDKIPFKEGINSRKNSNFWKRDKSEFRAKKSKIYSLDLG